MKPTENVHEANSTQGGKQHFVEELIRQGDVQVWVDRALPYRLFEKEYGQPVRRTAFLDRESGIVDRDSPTL